MKTRTRISLACIFLLSTAGFIASAQDITDTSKPLDENAMFGGEGDIVTVIDTAKASEGTIQLEKDTKTYPVFLVEGDANAGLIGSFTLYGAAYSQKLFGAVNLNSLSFSFLPSKALIFNITTDATLMSTGVQDLTTSAYADLRASEFTRVYAAASYNYNLTTNASSLVASKDGFSLDEIFVDTAIDRKLFFRLGKQRVSWGVGNWYKPADVLSLSAIDPDNPTANREGPFAFKTDMPFGLNHASLYIVPPTDGDPSKFSVAERTDLVVGGFELSFAGFYRSDLAAKPRLMFMFSGALGNFDIYGENVVAWGSDRIYVTKSGSDYITSTIENTPVFQSTLGVKYSWQNSDGLGLDVHVQGYYNGAGYADSSILQDDAAANAVIAAGGNTATRALRTQVRSDSGMYYLAANVSLSGRWGEGKNIVNSSLGGYALYNFSDQSSRFKPAWDLSIGSGGSKLDMTASALTAFGGAGSEYAPNGNMVTPALSMTILNAVVATVSAPLNLNPDYSLNKARLNFSLYWNVVNFDKK